MSANLIINSSPHGGRDSTVLCRSRTLGPQAIQAYFRDDSGATSAEYALILAAICVGLLAVIIALGDSIGGAVSRVNNGFPAS